MAEPRSALILGASGEIGSAIAKRLAAEGYAVVLGYHSGEKVAQALAEDLSRTSGVAQAIRVDVQVKEDVSQAVDLADSLGQGLWALVNASGILKEAFLTFMKDSDWDEMLNINLKGAFIATRHAAKTLIKRRGGRIIHISSVAGLHGDVMRAHYSASKAGMIGLAKSAARELARKGITVNVVAPGVIDTRMIGGVTDEKKKAMLERIPMARFGTATEVASTVSYLVSEDSSYVTGQVFCVDGGLSC